MSDYSQVNDYSAKDALATGNPEKLILGSDIDDELAAISTAITSKYDSGDLASQAQAEAETVNTVLMTPLRVANWADYNAGIVGDLQALADPNADRILGWDDSAGAAIGFAVGGALSTSGTTLQVTAADILTQLLTVDGASSTLDADLLDGQDGTYYTNASNLASGSVPDARLGNAALLTAANTFTGSTAGARNQYFINTSTGTTAYSGLIIQNSTRSLRATMLSTGYSGAFFGAGPSGEQGAVWTDGNVPLVLGTNAEAAMWIDGSRNFNFLAGTVTTNNSSASEVGFKGMPAASDETPVLTDAGKVIIAGGNVTIPANGSVAYPVGTVISVINNTASSITIAVTTDSMIFAVDGTTGTRTLAGRGIATLIKSASTTWYITGTGLS